MFRTKFSSEHKNKHLPNNKLKFISDDHSIHFKNNSISYYKSNNCSNPIYEKNSGYEKNDQILLQRKELQLLKLFKYLPSISSDILKQQFENRLPQKSYIIANLLGLPIKEYKLKENCNLFKPQEKFIKNIETHQEKIKRNQAVLPKIYLKKNFTRNTQEICVNPKITKNFASSLPIPEQFEFEKGISHERDEDLEEYLSYNRKN